MPDTQGKAMLLRLKRAWIAQRFFAVILLVLAGSLLVITFFHVFLAIHSYWLILLPIILFAGVSILNRWWKLTEWDVARFLNQSEPSLQESTELVLQPAETLTFLQRLQQQKVALQLTHLKSQNPLKRHIVKAAAILAVAIVVSAIFIYLPGKKFTPNRTVSSVGVARKNNPVLLPEIKKLAVIISPPAYTGMAAIKQDKFNLQVVEGSSVAWVIETTGQPRTVQLIFNDGVKLPMITTGNQQHNFKAQKLISKAGFYQLKLGDTLSELYKIEVIKDKAPTVIIQTPKPTTTVGFGQSQTVLLRAAISDDYGIQSANISATISIGSGEAVKFKQQTLSFENFSAGRRQYFLQKSLNLKALGMEPGNELYFFVTTTDTHNQETRSDVHIITLEDTTVESSMDGMVNGLDVKPDLFRSERQIIIETEQLLQDRNKISAEAFQKKSDDLGVDQKLLRLRYGKFLGEETDTEIGGHDHQGENGHTTDGAAEILEQYGHTHDNAEDATFFDAATKKQLKETLAEMWKAELQLRTYKPKEALEFEYKALRLLKDLQQKSRAYVAKTGFTPTPLKMEKRLTGELVKIGQPITQQQFDNAVLPEMVTRKAIGELEQLKESGVLQPLQKALLQSAFQQLSNKAAQAPSVYLPALAALKKVLSGSFRLRDIEASENGLQLMLNPSAKLPAAATVTNSKNLSTRYFINLSGGSPRK